MAIALVQSTTGASSQIVLTGVTAGNMLALWHTYFISTLTSTAPNKPIDSNGTFSTASADIPASFDGSANCGVAIFYESAAAAGTHNVTTQALNGKQITLAEFSGLSSVPFDVATSAVTNNSSQTAQSTNTTAALAGLSNLLLIGMGLAGLTGSSNVGFTDPVSTFTTLQKASNDATSVGAMHAYKVINVSTTQFTSFKWAFSEASSASHAAIASFKAAATSAAAGAILFYSNLQTMGVM